MDWKSCRCCVGPVRAGNAGGEEGVGSSACCFAHCDVGLGKKNAAEMKQAWKRDRLGRSL